LYRRSKGSVWTRMERRISSVTSPKANGLIQGMRRYEKNYLRATGPAQFHRP